MRSAILTDMQERFVLHFTSTSGAIGNAAEAARRAGYSEKTAAEQGHQLLQKPHVETAIREANIRLISGTAATKASALLEKLIDDDSVSDRVRLEAAKTILDRGGYTRQNGSLPDPDPKPHEEMSIEELEEIVRRGERRMRSELDVDAPPCLGEKSYLDPVD